MIDMIFRRGAPTHVTWTQPKDMPPAIKQEHFAGLKKAHGEWKEFTDKSEIHVYKGPPATTFKEKIQVSVNHFPLSKFQIPVPIYHYEVTFERVRRQPEGGGGGGGGDSKKGKKPQQAGGGGGGKGGKNKGGDPGGGGDGGGGPGGGAAVQPRKLPKPLPQLIIQFILNKIHTEKKFYGIVSDLSNNMYSTKPLEKSNIDMNYLVSMRDIDQTILQEDDDGVIKVVFARTELDIDPNKLKEMNEFLRSHGSWKGYGFDAAVSTVVEQVLNAVVKTFPQYRFLALGRSNLIRWPEERGEGNMPLGNNVVCWKGISANIGMGWKPYMNVDCKFC